MCHHPHFIYSSVIYYNRYRIIIYYSHFRFNNLRHRHHNLLSIHQSVNYSSFIDVVICFPSPQCSDVIEFHLSIYNVSASLNRGCKILIWDKQHSCLRAFLLNSQTNGEWVKWKGWWWGAVLVTGQCMMNSWRRNLNCDAERSNPPLNQ